MEHCREPAWRDSYQCSSGQGPLQLMLDEIREGVARGDAGLCVFRCPRNVFPVPLGVPAQHLSFGHLTYHVACPPARGIRVRATSSKVFLPELLIYQVRHNNLNLSLSEYLHNTFPLVTSSITSPA